MQAKGPALTVSATSPDEWAFRILVLVCWVLSVSAWSGPRRAGPLSLGALDSIAMIKLGTRVLSLALTGWILLRLHSAEGALQVFRRLTPFMIFMLWTVASVFWSPLKAVTAGHSVDLILLVMLAAVAGILANSEERLRILLCNLFITSFIVSLMVITLDYKAVFSGQRPVGYMQPNALGSFAGAGLIVLIGCKLLWGWDWARRMLPYGLFVCGLALFASRSRTAIFAVLIVVIVGCCLLRRSFLVIAMLLLMGCLFALAPYADTVAYLPDTVGAYFTRGESEQSIMGASGRDELWTKILQGFWESPVVGHGYYVASSSGFLHVWRKDQYQTAHSLPLHILTGTGVIGSLLFLWGFLAALGPTFGAVRRVAGMPRVDLFVLMVTGAYLIIGFFEISFLGPIGPDVVLFFTTLGVAARYGSALGAVRTQFRPELRAGPAWGLSSAVPRRSV